jgi:hypothetical protein
VNNARVKPFGSAGALKRKARTRDGRVGVNMWGAWWGFARACHPLREDVVKANWGAWVWSKVRLRRKRRTERMARVARRSLKVGVDA